MTIAARYLGAGCYRDGWALYEARREIADHPEQTLSVPVPAWRPPQPLAGKRVLLWHEQGLGDSIQMLRFVPLVARRGAQVVLAVPAALKRLAAGLPGVTQVVVSGETFEDADCHCPLMSLPHLLGIRLATLPAAPYLRVPPDAAARWRARLGPRTQPRIGLVCSGAARNSLDRWRSIAADRLAPLLARQDMAFHLLQSEIRPADRAFLARFPNVRLHDAALTDLAETGALAMQMDVTLTVCTAVAHLAGALALPAWVMLSTRAHWLWMQRRPDSPWYPTLRLFRQSAPDDWQSVVAAVGARLDGVPEPAAAWPATRHG